MWSGASALVHAWLSGWGQGEAPGAHGRPGRRPGRLVFSTDEAGVLHYEPVREEHLVYATAHLKGRGVLSASGQRTAVVEAELDAAGALVANGQRTPAPRTIAASAALTATGHSSASGVIGVDTAADLIGFGWLTATGIRTPGSLILTDAQREEELLLLTV